MRKNDKWTGNKKTAIIGLFIALAMVLSYLENLIPITLAVPGIKPGIANIVTIIALKKLGFKEALCISVGRVILSGILFSNPMVILYSLAGAISSITAMVIFDRLRLFTVTGISILGGIAHNLGQITVAVIIVENTRLFYYMAVLTVVGTIAGAFVGISASYIMKKVRFY